MVSAFKCVRRGRRVESAAVMEARSVCWSWVEGLLISSSKGEFMVRVRIEVEG